MPLEEPADLGRGSASDPSRSSRLGQFDFRVTAGLAAIDELQRVGPGLALPGSASYSFSVSSGSTSTEPVQSSGGSVDAISSSTPLLEIEFLDGAVEVLDLDGAIVAIDGDDLEGVATGRSVPLADDGCGIRHSLNPLRGRRALLSSGWTSTPLVVLHARRVQVAELRERVNVRRTGQILRGPAGGRRAAVAAADAGGTDGRRGRGLPPTHVGQGGRHLRGRLPGVCRRLAWRCCGCSASAWMPSRSAAASCCSCSRSKWCSRGPPGRARSRPARTPRRTTAATSRSFRWRSR